MKIGDIVEWKSQAKGTWKTKRGKIIAVVSAGTLPREYKGGEKIETCTPRDHNSVLVRVGSAVYWPRVAALKEVEATDKEALLREALGLLDRAMPQSDGWWCPTCQAEIPPSRVTFGEHCESCGTHLGSLANPEWVAAVRAIISTLEAKEILARAGNVQAGVKACRGTDGATCKTLEQCVAEAARAGKQGEVQ